MDKLSEQPIPEEWLRKIERLDSYGPSELGYKSSKIKTSKWLSVPQAFRLGMDYAEELLELAVVGDLPPGIKLKNQMSVVLREIHKFKFDLKATATTNHSQIEGLDEQIKALEDAHGQLMAGARLSDLEQVNKEGKVIERIKALEDRADAAEIRANHHASDISKLEKVTAHEKPRPDPKFDINFPLIDPVERKDRMIKHHCDVLRDVADEIENA